jgi:hypothetical protein
MGPWIRIRIRNPDPDLRGQKWPRKIENFTVSSAGCSLLRAEGFSCSLDFLYGGLGISKFQFLIKKRNKEKFSCLFSSYFWSSKPMDLYPDSLKMPDPDSITPDPQHCLKVICR